MNPNERFGKTRKGVSNTPWRWHLLISHFHSPEPSMQRRHLLQVSALSALSASMGLTRSAFAQAPGAIQFGCPVPMSGPFAANGKFADM
eukprot:gene31819-54187_t